MFYYSEALLFHVWEGLGSCLFRVVIFIDTFGILFVVFWRFVGLQGPNGMGLFWGP